MQDPKYTALQDEDGTWSVMDAAEDMPAVLDGVPQVGLREEEAREVATVLNAMVDDGDG